MTAPALQDLIAYTSTRLWALLERKLGPGFSNDPKLRADVTRLSLAFTEGREDLAPDYFSKPAIRRAYLAYFVPLNFWKVKSILLSHEVRFGTRWLDYGCGPGTATLAALEVLAEKRAKGETQGDHALEIHLVDRVDDLLAEAKETVGAFARTLGIEARIVTHRKLPSLETGAFDLSLAANVLNELPQGDDLLELWRRTSGTFFLLEPGHRVSSQRLVRFRERLLNDVSSKGSARILGPCPHQERCPVYRTKHWCHFSEPLHDDKLLALNRKFFKNERAWLKFSYLLVARGEPKAFDGKTYRAIGDLHMSGPGHLAIDLCQPAEKRVLRIPRTLPQKVKNPLVRGAVVTLNDGDKIQAQPMTPRAAQKPRVSDKPKPKKR